MGTKHTVRFEPVGIEIEVDEDETVLNAAFRQGVMLMHGCKEGQCSACKSDWRTRWSAHRSQRPGRREECRLRST